MHSELTLRTCKGVSCRVKVKPAGAAAVHSPCPFDKQHTYDTNEQLKGQNIPPDGVNFERGVGSRAQQTTGGPRPYAYIRGMIEMLGRKKAEHQQAVCC